MRRSEMLALSVPLLLVLIGLIIHEQLYVKVGEDLKRLREEKAMKTRTLNKYMALIAEQPQLDTRLAGLREQRKAADSKIVEGRTPSLGAAALQEMVKDIVLGRGGTISSERVEKPEDSESFKIITISMDTVLPDIGALSDLLYTLETRTPFLAVREVDARVRNFKEPRELMVKFRISALMAGQ
jgi:hypothetical protein